MDTRTGLFALLVSIAITGCGSGTMEPGGDGDSGQVATSIEIVDGDGQTVQVNESSDTISAQVEAEQGPARDVLTTWEVDGPSGCGNWEATALETDTQGRAKNILHVGTIADTRTDVSCTFRIVHSEEGAPSSLVDSVEVTIEPGELWDWHWQEPSDWNERVSPGDTIDLRTWVREAEDRHGNPIPLDDVVGVHPVEWRMSDRTSNGTECKDGPGDGTAGSGWDVEVPDFVERGYTLFRTPVVSEEEGDLHQWEINVRLSITNEAGNLSSTNDVLMEQIVGHTPVTDPPTLPDACK